MQTFKILEARSLSDVVRPSFEARGCARRTTRSDQLATILDLVTKAVLNIEEANAGGLDLLDRFGLLGNCRYQVA